MKQHIVYLAAGVVGTLLLFGSVIKAIELIRYDVLGCPIIVSYDADGEEEVRVEPNITFVIRSDGLIGWQLSPKRPKRKVGNEDKIKSFPIGREIFGGTK